MPRADLEQLVARCDAYTVNCADKGQERAPQYIALCAAARHYLADYDNPQGIKAAFDAFSEARRAAMAAGYEVPSIVGTHNAGAILDAVAVLREAVAVATPL